MKSQIMRYSIIVCLMSVFSLDAFAQKYEVHPFAGRTYFREWADAYGMKNDIAAGVKAAVFATDTTQFEGEFGYIPHFEFENTDPKTRALFWGVGVSRNLFLSNTKFIPFFSYGAGGLTLRMDSPDTVTYLLDGSNAQVASSTSGPAAGRVTVENNDTFFAFNYGGGVKILRVTGPVGFRGNITGRTLPNFFGRNLTWLELSGGITVSWGER